MIPPKLRTEILTGLGNGSIVPYLGPGVLSDVVSDNGAPMPATSDELILGLNGGKPMAPKLMYEFPRAAMNVELKRGRSAVTRFLDTTYGATHWSRGAVHDWLQAFHPQYVIDINRDTQLIDSYAGIPHILILGCARIGGTDFRFKLYAYDGVDYTAIVPEQAPPGQPVLFKPMGAPRPEPSYIASDADYVDFITELMGGFAVPAFVKTMRRDKRYLLLGLRLNRDTERMVLADLIYGAATPAGWALIENATDKERRFLDKLKIELIEASLHELMTGAAVEAVPCSSWDETRHSLGMPVMDATHREFVALAAQLAQAATADFPRLFETLFAHTREHFENESKLMRSCGFPAIAEHEGEHQRVLGELAHMQRSLAAGRLAIARDYVANGLPDWFGTHLATMDAALAACLKRSTQTA